MPLSRETIETTYRSLWQDLNNANWDNWLDYFADDARFTNSAIRKTIQGRDALAEMAATFPEVINKPEWHSIDGNRLVVSWLERPATQPDPEMVYRGVSSFLFDDDGKVVEYVGVFDMEDVMRVFTAGG